MLRAHFGAARVLATEGNLNNAIGLPLTLLGLRAEHAAAAIELGMNHPGETAELAAIAQPTVAVINNAQREHQEFMRSVADVAAEHAAIVRALPADGVAVLNADDAACGRLARRGARARRACASSISRSTADAAVRLRGAAPGDGADRARDARGRGVGAARGAGTAQRVECARGGGGGARDRRAARGDRARARGVSSRRRTARPHCARTRAPP